jgi:hypothetical protein
MLQVARSPASAIAVAKELRAKGIFTSTLLGITVFCDVYVLILFTLASTVSGGGGGGGGGEGVVAGGCMPPVQTPLLRAPPRSRGLDGAVSADPTGEKGGACVHVGTG